MGIDMVQRRLDPGLYVITDCAQLPFAQTLEKTDAILSAGVAVLQYRNKTADIAGRLEQACILVDLCRRHQTSFIVNDDVNLALRCGADGVHLGRDDIPCAEARRTLGPEFLIGISCNGSLERARTAQTDSADYAAFGAFFPTTTKRPSARPEPGLLTLAKAELHIPLVAIGGITADNAGVLLAAGADNLAVVSALYGAQDPATAVREFQAAFKMYAHAEGDPSEQSII